jgi:hypothetical protein
MCQYFSDFTLQAPKAKDHQKMRILPEEESVFGALVRHHQV